MKNFILFSTLLFASSIAVAAHHAKTLTDDNGMSLYTFDKDSDGQSVCYDSCAVQWPPFIAKDGAAERKGWGTTQRKDGSKQWTFNGQPLYTWVGDKKSGDTTGDGVGGVWHLATKGDASHEKKKSNDGSY